ncbi:CMRF35-like molecule 1, partial [Pseudorasbora parva]|uniref:CMRF35-like molecule 1 n=1 Tax=Pseudorasbora parva TaxID=51549 RepID=UPI00351EE308
TDNTTAKVFTVTITDLRTEDEGRYWCAVERTLATDRAITDVYSEIYLQFKQAVVVGDPETVIGHRGERVDIRCTYDSGYEANQKYFCRGNCLFSNKIIIKSGSPAKDERFSLTDDTTARVFTVTITDLRTEDEGRYWCAVERTLTDVYSEISLQIKQEYYCSSNSLIHLIRISSVLFSHVNITCLAVHTDLAPVAVGLGSALLVLTLCSGVLLILKKRKWKSGTALFHQSVQLKMETYHIYEEISNSDDTAVTSSANQTPASHLNTRPKVSTVYATVTNQQPDSNPSHTHNQMTDTDWDYFDNMNPPEATQDSGTELIYTTVTHPQIVTTNECPIYSVIN